jgi:hypothetical protein
MDSGMSNRYTAGMSTSAYFEDAMVLSEERQLIEAQTRKPDNGELCRPDEIEDIAKERGILI